VCAASWLLAQTLPQFYTELDVGNRQKHLRDAWDLASPAGNWLTILNRRIKFGGFDVSDAGHNKLKEEAIARDLLPVHFVAQQAFLVCGFRWRLRCTGWNVCKIALHVEISTYYVLCVMYYLCFVVKTPFNPPTNGIIITETMVKLRFAGRTVWNSLHPSSAGKPGFGAGNSRWGCISNISCIMELLPSINTLNYHGRTHYLSW
jgi:hypothetical protein